MAAPPLSSARSSPPVPLAAARRWVGLLAEEDRPAAPAEGASRILVLSPGPDSAFATLSILVTTRCFSPRPPNYRGKGRLCTGLQQRGRSHNRFSCVDRVKRLSKSSAVLEALRLSTQSLPQFSFPRVICAANHRILHNGCLIVLTASAMDGLSCERHFVPTVGALGRQKDVVRNENLSRYYMGGRFLHSVEPMRPASC